MKSPFRLAVAAVAATAVLSACGASAPPARELADEMIDTLEDSSGTPLSDAEKQCMHTAVAEFKLTEEEVALGYKDLDDAASKADSGQDAALAIIDRFEQELRSCVRSG